MKMAGGEILLESRKDEAGEILEPAGTVDIAGLNEKQIQAYRGRVISMIFQEPMTSLNPSMRSGDQVAEAVRLQGKIPMADVRDRVHSLLEEVHLPSEFGFYKKYPHQLSGGQRQRIMIAMALAGNPQILIADEPTTALDVTVQKKILELLQEIRKNRKMSILFISHDLGVIRTVCENALVMYKGQMVESGKVSQLFRKPKHPYTRGLIACRPVPGEHPVRLPTLGDFMDPGNLPDCPSDGTDGKQGIIEGKFPMLEVKNLQVNYTLKKNILGKPVQSLQAVNNVSFKIATGETLGLIGESGCGKSTLGRSIIRLIQAGKGEILYHGKDVSYLKRKDLNRYRQKVQFIFQDPYSSLNPRIAACPSIMEVMKVHGIHKTKAARRNAVLKLLRQVGLEQYHFGRYPHEFSGGQRQRIGLARALASNPELIICDESVSSLDVSVQAMILNLLNDLKDEFNLTYLFISHDLSVVRYMSDRILVMKDGRLVEQGSGEQIFSNPSTEYTQELIDSILDEPR
jgi:peptide/nickel transport system ATP-binding protein